MSDNQNNSSIYMQIDNYTSGENYSNVVNNYLPSLHPTSQNSESLPNLPDQILEALTTIKKYLSRQEKDHEIKISTAILLVPVAK